MGDGVVRPVSYPEVVAPVCSLFWFITSSTTEGFFVDMSRIVNQLLVTAGHHFFHFMESFVGCYPSTLAHNYPKKDEYVEDQEWSR